MGTLVRNCTTYCIDYNVTTMDKVIILLIYGPLAMHDTMDGSLVHATE